METDRGELGHDGGPCREYGACTWGKYTMVEMCHLTWVIGTESLKEERNLVLECA